MFQKSVLFSIQRVASVSRVSGIQSFTQRVCFGGVRAFSGAPAKLSVLTKKDFSDYQVQEVEDRVLELLKNFSKTKQEKLNIDAHFVNDLGLDSLDQVEITMELEDEFNIELTDSVAEKIFTVKEAVEAV